MENQGANTQQLDISGHLTVSSGLEGYALSSNSDTAPKIALVLASNPPGIAAAPGFTSFSLTDLPSTLDGTKLAFTAYRVYGTILNETVVPPVPVGKNKTLESLSLSFDPVAHRLDLTAPGTITLGPDELLFVILQPN